MAVVIAQALALVLFGCRQASGVAPLRDTSTDVVVLPAGSVAARVVRVVDGDTIQVELENGERPTLRLIGIDTPETVDPREPVACFGPEASAAAQRLLDMHTVYLEKDVSETDRFGRLLRYVYLETGEMVNELLVRDGYAQVFTYPPDVKHQARLLEAQRAAREKNAGLWGACGAGPR